MEQTTEQRPERRGTGGPRWYVARTEPGRERFAEKRVKAARFETFYPEWVVRMRQGRFKMLCEKPMFPNYLFVRFDAVADPWGLVLDAPGIVAMLCQAQQPVAVPDRAIDLIREQMAQSREMTRAPQRILYLRGQLIEILDGLFAGKKATFEERAGDLVIVWLDTEAGGVRLKMPQELVAALP